MQGALQAGEEQLLAWTRDGTLMPVSELAEHWGLTIIGVRQAARRGEIFVVKVRGRVYAPSDFAQLRREDLAQVLRPLEGLSSTEKLLLWLEPQKDLGGQTFAGVIRQGNARRASEIAGALAQECLGHATRSGTAATSAAA